MKYLLSLIFTISLSAQAELNVLGKYSDITWTTNASGLRVASFAAGGGGSTITRVQWVAAPYSLTATFSNSVTAGNLIVVFVASTAEKRATGCSDSLGNSYTQLVDHIVAGYPFSGPTTACFYSIAGYGGSNIVTVAIPSVESASVAVVEYSGVSSVNTLSFGDIPASDPATVTLSLNPTSSVVFVAALTAVWAENMTGNFTLNGENGVEFLSSKTYPAEIFLADWINGGTAYSAGSYSMISKTTHSSYSGAFIGLALH